MKYTYIKDYKSNDKLRKGFNELAKKIHQIDFTEWHDNGFWREKYIPYSFFDGEKAIANVSINLMDFKMDGIEKHYIQIGTVMTDEGYRNFGLIRYLIEKIIYEYKDKVDGIYLFANDTVLDFYPKFGFKKGKEYQYSKEIDSSDNIKKVQPIDMGDKANWKDFFNTLENSVSNDRFNVDNLGLVAFWTTGWLNNCVYYLQEEKAYIIAEINEEVLEIYQVIAECSIDLETVISSFGNKIKKVVMGFTPYNEMGYTVKELKKEDCTLFILGEDLEDIEKKKLIFPALSHA